MSRASPSPDPCPSHPVVSVTPRPSHRIRPGHCLVCIPTVAVCVILCVLASSAHDRCGENEHAQPRFCALEPESGGDLLQPQHSPCSIPILTHTPAFAVSCPAPHQRHNHLFFPLPAPSSPFLFPSTITQYPQAHFLPAGATPSPVSIPPPPSPPVSLPTFPLLWRTRQRASGSSTQAISASGRLAAGRTWSLSGGHNCKCRRRVLCICRWLVYALHTQTPENFKLCAAIKRNVRTCQCTRGRACGSAA